MTRSTHGKVILVSVLCGGGTSAAAPRQYQTPFKALAEQDGQQKNFTEITRNACDRAIEDGTPIARQPFGFVTKALFFQGCAIGEARMGPEEIARLFRNNVRNGSWVHSSISRAMTRGC